MTKMLCSQCRGPRFDPWSGNYIPCVKLRPSAAKKKTPKNLYFISLPIDASHTHTNPLTHYYRMLIIISVSPDLTAIAQPQL